MDSCRESGERERERGKNIRDGVVNDIICFLFETYASHTDNHSRAAAAEADFAFTLGAALAGSKPLYLWDIIQRDTDRC